MCNKKNEKDKTRKGKKPTNQITRNMILWIALPFVAFVIQQVSKLKGT